MKTNSLDFDAQALREKILDLAMRGKLVPQDPNDEPASELLKKIKAEKAELIKEKKIKKSKPLPPITDNEKPFDIPDSWEWVRCKTVTTIGNFQSLSPEKIKSGENLIELADIESYSGKLINRECVTKKVGSNKYRYSKGNVLFAKLRPYLRKVLLAPNDGVCTTELLPIDGIKTDNNYLYYVFLSSFFFGQIEKEMHGVNLPRVSPKKLSALIIPLPPLSEQSRIAAKIAQLFALLRKVESSTQQYAELQTLLKTKVLDLAMRGKLVKQDPNDEPASVLLEKIKAEKTELVKEKKIKKSKPLPPITDEEKPFDIPDSWKWVRISDVLDVRDGTHDTPKYVADGIPLITSKNISNGKLDFTNINFISKDDFEKINERSKVDKGDIIFAMIGTIGNPVLVDTDTKFGIKNVALLKHFTDKLNMDFILDYLLVLQVIWNSNATGAVQKFVSLRKIRKSVLPLPPFKEQKKIVRKIDQIFRMIGE